MSSIGAINQSAPNFFNPELEYDLLRSVCSRSFYRFVQEFWHIVVPEQPTWNWHIEYLCQKLDAVFDDVTNGRPKKHDLIINISPSSSKSTIFSILFPAYVWTKMPSCRFITASFNMGLAEDFARKSKAIIKSDLYEKCFGKFRFIPEQAGHYMNDKGGERIVCTTTTSPTGRHAHFILVDDPVDPLDQDRAVSIHNVNTWMHRVIRSRAVDARITPLILIMQRLAEDDPTGDWIEKVNESGEKNKIFHICLPASIEAGQEVKPAGLKRYYQDGLFDPVRLPYSVLKDRKMWMTASDYSAQYDQNPLPKEGLLFKVQKLLVKTIDELDPVVAKVRYWDKAISTKANACYTAGTLMGRTKTGKFVVMDVVRGQWEAADREAVIKNTAKADGPTVVIGVEREPGPIYENEEILMGNRTYKPLKEIKVGDWVLNKLGNRTKVVKVLDAGMCPCVRVGTYNEHEVCAAIKHPIITPDGPMFAGDLSRGDVVCVMEGLEPVEDEVCDVIECGEKHCICLEVADEASFVAGDIIVHNSGGLESAQYTARNLAGFMVHIDPVNSSKEVRAETLAIQVEHNNVYLLEGPWNAAFLSEMAGFPNAKLKDQVDSCVGAFRMLCGAGTLTAGALF